jgi:hypothetical protein
MRVQAHQTYVPYINNASKYSICGVCVKSVHDDLFCYFSHAM